MQKAADMIVSLTGNKPIQVAMVLGSGSGPLVSLLTDVQVVPYADIPGFSACGVKGHGGQLHLGFLHGVHVACFQGRRHWYEGVTPEAMRPSLALMHALKIPRVLLTNAVGSLHKDWMPGQLVLLRDHINMQGLNPLSGLSDPERSFFIGMDGAYHKVWREHCLAVAESISIDLPEGVYIGTLGPSFETPAEIKAFQTMGADVVGMSTVSEVILARYYGIEVAAISVISNLAAGLTDTPLSHEVTLAGVKLGMANLTDLLDNLFKTRGTFFK
jgi:inosine/guanosine/xanthosine phosphorylase family protein